MKIRFQYFAVVALSLLILASCRSSYIRYVDVETVHPAKITFPVYIRNIAFVNNALGSSKCTISEGGGPEFSLMDADSLAMDMLALVADSLSHSPYFDLVTIGSIADTSSMILKRMSPGLLDEVRDATGAQTVISMDGFQMVIDKTYFSRTNELVLEFVGKTFFKIYEPGNDDTPQTHICVDTMVWNSGGWGFYLDDMHFLMDKVSDAIAYFASQNINRFIPYLRLSERYVYVTGNTSMLDAERYVIQDKWEEASYLWEHLYETGEGETLRAKAASNMAVVCEMRDDFSAAIDWAKKSYDLFNQPAVREKNIEELRSMDNYIKLLQQRQKEIPLLQEQMDRRR